MTVYELNPLTDSRWPEFLARHPEASIFHTREWLAALRNTYGYEPVAFTTSDRGELSNAVVFCQIRSWMTGRRLVSLPFSDHCQPLASGAELTAILQQLHRRVGTDGLKYVEIRPLTQSGLDEAGNQFSDSEQFSLQKIDLRPDLKLIYRGFHDSCVRRKIKRAEKEGLTYAAGRSEHLLLKFRQLLMLTRRRHKLPPQPASWFRNIALCLGDRVTIHLLSKDDQPIASIMTFSYKKSIVYKYGCSDSQFNSMGANPLLFWNVIQQAKEAGAEEFDLGRSSYEDPGLIAFKEHLGATSSELKYYRDPAPGRNEERSRSVTSSWAREALARLPDPLLAGAGELLYRHIG